MKAGSEVRVLADPPFTLKYINQFLNKEGIMISVILQIDGLGINNQWELFKIQTTKKSILEIRQAVDGEINYNKTQYDLGGLIYE